MVNPNKNEDYGRGNVIGILPAHSQLATLSVVQSLAASSSAMDGTLLWLT
jgi:hypothetical protein